MAEALLWQEFYKTKSEDVREQLITNHLPLVKLVASRTLFKLPNHIDKEDLISFGILGLIDAVEKFDLDQGVKFSSYAYTRIKGAIYDEIRKNSLLPRTVMQQIKEYTKVQSELEASLGKEASLKEIAKKMGTKEEDLDLMLQYVNMFSMTSLDEFFELGEGDMATKVQVVEDKGAVDPAKIIEKSEEEKTLAQAIDNLEERDKFILSLYYFEELTLMEIGQVLDISESRVCQLHARALTRLKGQLEKMKFEKSE